MPELPEVETIARQLDKVLSGKIIQSVETLNAKSLRGYSLQVVGKQILGISRKQKIIVIKLQDISDKSQDIVVLIHLKMTGQLIYLGSKNRVVGGHPTADWVGDLPSKHTRVMINFTDGSRLFFNDQRIFGWVKVVTSDSWRATRKLMAPDVVDKEFTLLYLTNVLKRSGRAIKLVILDQDKVGGMGNIYANDALFLARIHPLRAANQLKAAEVLNLYESMKEVIQKGIKTGGASISHFVDSEGAGGHYQDHFLVYEKEGQPCLKCGTRIEKIKVGGRGTHFCPICQR